MKSVKSRDHLVLVSAQLQLCLPVGCLIDGARANGHEPGTQGAQGCFQEGDMNVTWTANPVVNGPQCHGRCLIA